MWQVIEKRLKELNKTVHWLSKEVGISHQALYQIKNGYPRDFRLSTAFKLADVLGIDVNEFRKE